MNNLSHDKSLRNLQKIAENEYWELQQDSQQKNKQVIVRISKDTRGSIKKIREFAKVLMAAQKALEYVSDANMTKDQFKEIRGKIEDRYGHLKEKISQLSWYKRVFLWFVEKRYSLDRIFQKVMNTMNSKGIYSSKENNLLARNHSQKIFSSQHQPFITGNNEELYTSFSTESSETKTKKTQFDEYKEKLKKAKEKAQKVSKKTHEFRKDIEKATCSIVDEAQKLARQSEKDDPENIVKEIGQDIQELTQDAKGAAKQAAKSVKGFFKRLFK